MFIVRVDCLALSKMLAGGMAIVLELVSCVLEENTVGLVDWIECISEKVEDLTDDEQTETKGAILDKSISWSDTIDSACCSLDSKLYLLLGRGLRHVLSLSESESFANSGISEELIVNLSESHESDGQSGIK